jgi:hypothetical protein
LVNIICYKVEDLVEDWYCPCFVRIKSYAPSLVIIRTGKLAPVDVLVLDTVLKAKAHDTVEERVKLFGYPRVGPCNCTFFVLSSYAVETFIFQQCMGLLESLTKLEELLAGDGIKLE